MLLTALPIEVLDLIIDELPLPSTLLSLSLTCRLFCSLTIPFPLLSRTLDWPSTANSDIALRCAQWIQEKPRRGKAVRDLRIDLGRCSDLPVFLRPLAFDDAEKPNESPVSPISLVPLSYYIPCMPNITSLSLSCIPYSSLSALISLLPHLANLTSLAISHTLVLEPDIRAIFAALPDHSLPRFRIIDPGVWMLGSGGDGWARARMYVWGNTLVQAPVQESGKVVQLPGKCPGVESCCGAAIWCEDRPLKQHGHRHWRSLPCAARFCSFSLDGASVEGALGERRIVTLSL